MKESKRVGGRKSASRREDLLKRPASTTGHIGHTTVVAIFSSCTSHTSLDSTIHLQIWQYHVLLECASVIEREKERFVVQEKQK
jgi:hypothetical protein